MAVVNTMGPASNLGQINLNAGSSTTAYFNNFFEKNITVSSAKDDAIVSYFEKITPNKDAALALASAVLYTSAQQGVDPMVVLDEFKKMSTGTLTDYLCYFLNLSRVGTSLIGTRVHKPRNKYITRTILL